MAALARAVQNPVADPISLPFQNNTNFNQGPRDHAQNVPNVQPAVPVSLNPDRNLISRTILPVISQPGLEPGQGTTFGLDATQVSAFLSPARPGEVIWSAGPSLVAPTMQGPWGLGALVNNIWSFGGRPRNTSNTVTVQPFTNFRFPHSPGTYVSYAPIITADREARGGGVWTVPVGLAVGQATPIGR